MQSTNTKSLPDNPAQLKALLFDQEKQLRTNQKQLASKDLVIKLLQEQLNLALHHRFGKTSEKHPGQHELFDEPEDTLEQAGGVIGGDEGIEGSADLDAIDVSAHPR